jgi:hypothetical protein
LLHVIFPKNLNFVARSGALAHFPTGTCLHKVF